jgi:hypothetical protein
VGTVHQPVPFQYAQVAPDGFRGHAQLGGELADVDRALRAGRYEDLVLPLLRLHATHLCPTGPV